MKKFSLNRNTVKVLAVLVPLFALFAYVAVRTGPFAAVAVTTTTVKSQAIAPALAGIGTVQARYTFQIGPTVPGRVKWLKVDVGDYVQAGQVLGEMDPVDLHERIEAQQAAIKSAEAALRQEEARRTFAKAQADRYDKLLASQTTSQEVVATKRQELKVADAALEAAREDAARRRSELEALNAQSSNLRLVAPVDGLVTAREVDPGTTVVAGQTVVEMIDPTSLWVETRFDQISAEGLTSGLAGQVVLRSRPEEKLSAKILRVEPKADVVTEEMLAKVVFDQLPMPLPSVGELTEVTVQLARLPATPTIPNAALHAYRGRRGVWKLTSEGMIFTPVVLGRADLEGRVQIKKGLDVGDRLVLYSEKALRPHLRIRVVEDIPGVAP